MRIIITGRHVVISPLLKEMCESRAPGPLVTRTDVVINRDRHDRDRVIAIEHDAKPVREAVFLDLKWG